MADVMTVTVKGLEELQRKAEQLVREMQGAPMVRAMRRATLLVERSAKQNLQGWRPPGGPGRAGVDTGRMRASITPSVTDRPLTGIVGSNVFYAPYQELGTRPHYVSKEHIGRWAERHGLGYRAVFVSGRALRFLQRALEANREKIRGLFEKAVKGIVER